MTGSIDSSQLEDVVKRMRALGVTKFGGIELGPDPNQRPGEGETERTAEASRLKAEREERIRRGASGGPRPRVGKR